MRKNTLIIGKMIWKAIYFPLEATKTRRKWQNIFHMLKEKKKNLSTQYSVSSKK